MERKELKKLNRKLSELTSERLSISDFIAKASEFHPQLPPVFEGIYCGTDGRMHEQIPETKFWLVMTWYADPNSSLSPKLEVAYIS